MNSSLQQTKRLAEQIARTSQSRRASAFPAFSASVSDYYGKFQDLCSPTQVAVVLAILHIALRAYAIYSKGVPSNYDEEIKAGVMLVAMLGASYYFCEQGQSDYAWVVIAVYVVAVVYGYINDPTFTQAKSMYERGMAYVKQAPEPVPAPVEVPQAPPQSGLIIEQDQSTAFDPHGAKYASVM